MWLQREGSPRSCVHWPRTQSRAVPDVDACVRVLSLSFSLGSFLNTRTHTRARMRMCTACTYALSHSSHSFAFTRAESGERPLSRVYAPVCVGCWPERGPLARARVLSLFLSRSLFAVTSHQAAQYVYIRTCVSTCERAVCLHTRRQRHAVSHTGLLVVLRPREPRLVPLTRHGTSLHLHTIRYGPQGRQVAHKTKETQEKRAGGTRDSDGEKSGGMG